MESINYSEILQNKNADKLNEIKGKVTAFHTKLNELGDDETIFAVFNYLCPSLTEKIIFKAYFDRTYPNDKASKLINEAVDCEFNNQYMGKLLKLKLNELTELYQAIYNAAESVNLDSKTIQNHQTQQAINNINTPNNRLDARVVKVVRRGIFKKGYVSQVSTEELENAKNPPSPYSVTIEKEREKYLMDKYNKRLKERLKEKAQYNQMQN